MEGSVGAVFIGIQLGHRSIDVLDLFHRSWNAELLRNAAAEATGCLLRFPLLCVGGTLYSGVVASVHTSGAIRVVSSGCVEAALAISDFVYAYVVQRLPPRTAAAAAVDGDTKSIVFFQVVLNPVPSPQQERHVNTSETGAARLRDHIASSSLRAAAGEREGEATHNSLWWRALTDSSVACRQYRHTLRIVCRFKQPAPFPVRGAAAAGGGKKEECEADAFFGSEMMSVMPMGSMFVAVPHTAEKNGEDADDFFWRKRLRHESETTRSLQSASAEPAVVDGTALPPHQAAAEGEGEGEGAPASRTGEATTVCPLVAKPQMKVEAMVYRTGRVFVTADSVAALSFVVEEILLPLFQN
ncbi:hypothetical protein DQ04_01581060 [Trypanosoma grayi]|uniref:hypothetical protein n=1 Tax=Trypanosoma grayi TaxID=71804 RepID=UPI0004F4019A|nr:hypothetical protein DQ04_01581060 [Trypanosoma grayi]KEG12609.1 hypothetical protein DQ04_01581060 [Trypanosoma grayi]